MMPLKTDVCRWGILSTAGIAKKNWRAISRSKIGRVAMVASRDTASAQRFIDECQSNCPFEEAPRAIGSYQGLLESKDIDAVYIPLPTGIRKEWILAAAKHGKHILAEKPAALSAADVQEILDVCKSQGVQYMDGVMFMHSRRLENLRATLDSPEGIGAVKRIATQFSFNGDQEFRTKNIRSNSQYEPHGSLGDLGWYTIRMILWVNQWRMPKQVSARCISTLQGQGSPQPVPMEFSAELLFDNGVSANFYVSFATEHQQWCHISGERGSIWLDDFVLPYYGSNVGYELIQPEFVTDVCDFHMHKRSQRFSVAEYDSGHSPSQEINMFDNFHELLKHSSPDESWGRITLQTQQVLDAVFEAAGCKL